MAGRQVGMLSEELEDGEIACRITACAIRRRSARPTRHAAYSAAATGQQEAAIHDGTAIGVGQHAAGLVFEAQSELGDPGDGTGHKPGADEVPVVEFDPRGADGELP
ncbi:MAG: hypothetical protein ACLQIB_58780 [Isosphaeraceae bacterium]